MKKLHNSLKLNNKWLFSLVCVNLLTRFTRVKEEIEYHVLLYLTYRTDRECLQYLRCNYEKQSDAENFSKKAFSERKMGEMLRETERAKPGPVKKDQLPNVTDLPTLAELGLTKRDRKIFDMWMQCYTQEEIAEAVEMERTSITKITDDYVKVVPQNQIHKIAMNHADGFEPPLYNIWTKSVKANKITKIGNLQSAYDKLPESGNLQAYRDKCCNLQHLQEAYRDKIAENANLQDAYQQIAPDKHHASTGQAPDKPGASTRTQVNDKSMTSQPLQKTLTVTENINGIGKKSNKFCFRMSYALRYALRLSTYCLQTAYMLSTLSTSVYILEVLK